MAKIPRGLLKQLGITPTSRSKPAPLTSKMKKRMEEVKGITKGKRFEETKKIADAKDKKKRDNQRWKLKRKHQVNLEEM